MSQGGSVNAIQSRAAAENGYTRHAVVLVAIGRKLLADMDATRASAPGLHLEEI